MGQFVDEIAEKAIAALREQDPLAAAKKLQAALREAPDRVDLIHALAVTELRLGEAASALALTHEGERIAREKQDDAAELMMPQLLLVRAAAAEDLGEPAQAEAAYREVLAHESFNPRARTGLGHLLLAWGRTEEGLAQLDAYAEEAADDGPYLEAQATLTASVRAFARADVHPQELLAAHRGSYVEFFNHHGEPLVAQGWIAEPARMARDEDGTLVLSVPDGARPWAAVRVDLVNPSTGQVGRVGDQPMVVAIAGYEPLAHSPVLWAWPPREHPFPVWVSSQAPWNHLRVAVRFAAAEPAAAAALDEVVGDWYRAGFDGAFGSTTGGRFHEASDAEPFGRGVVVYHFDLGRAEVGAVPDLLRRLALLHDRHPISAVLVGRGQVPVAAG